VIAKRCAAPKDGGSARGNVRYILGYSLSEKRELWEEKNASYHALMAESQARPDLGVGVTWKPDVGAGVRPSAVLALNVVSLATADLEMQSTAQANPRVKSATHHEVFSFGHDPNITDEEALEAVRRVYDRVGLGSAQMVLAVHRDTEAVHVHAARASVNPMTLRAYDHQMINTRLDRAARHVELEMGLAHDRGLAVVDQNASGTAIVRDSTRPERVAWARENGEERLAQLERVRYVDNERREGSFERWADARVEPRLRDVLRNAKDAGESTLAIDVLNKAARHGCRIQVEGDGHAATVLLRDVSTGRLRAEQRLQIAEAAARLKANEANGLIRDETLDALRAVHVKEIQAEIKRLEHAGAAVELSPKMRTELLDAFGSLEVLRDPATAEETFIAAIDADVGLVTRTLTQHASTFSREIVDQYLVERIDDVGEIERLAHKIFTDDPSLVLLSPDVADGVWTTREMAEVERLLAVDAAALAERRDPDFDLDRRQKAIEAMEGERTVGIMPFRLSTEQRDALMHTGQLVAIKGRPGVGKTVLMEAIRRDAETAGRKIQGITVAQAAAARLEVEAGFECVNSAFALLADQPKRELVPKNGILVLDEAGMIDSRTMRALLRIAEERNTSVVALADPRQIPPVGAGGAWHIIEAAARSAGTYSELNDIRRQQRPWHREAVHLVSDAIDQRDEPTFLRAAELLEKNGALGFTADKDEAIQQIVAWYGAERAISADVLLVATDRDTVRYLNEEIRRQENRTAGRRYLTDGGVRSLTIGDRFIFGENNTNIGCVNGDTGRVVETGSIIIGVQLDRTGELVKFDSRRYDRWDHGYATTVARSQGASVRAIGGIIDGAATAEIFNVLTSRSKASLRALVPATAFEDRAALAEHLAEHIVGKGTTQDISLEIASHGGPNSFYARNVNAQRLSAASPDRQEYEAEWTLMRTERDRELRNLAEHYRQRREQITEPAELKTLRQQQRRDEVAIGKTYHPEDFGTWLHRKRDASDLVEARLQSLARHRDERERTRNRNEKQANTKNHGTALEQKTTSRRR
jgi:hypothetical protein